MAEITTSEVRAFLSKIQGQEISLPELRREFQIQQGTKSFDLIRNIMFQLAELNVVRPTKRGYYKVVVEVKPVEVFGVERERRPLFDLVFPKDKRTDLEIEFAGSVVIREGDLITMGGTKSSGKTLLCLNFCAENIDKRPVLMGNEYTIAISDDGVDDKVAHKIIRYEPAPRFLNRLDVMREWVNWVDENGKDKFTLLPVREDYAEHIVKNRINIIDWINLGGDRLYDIGKVLESIKANLGRGIAIIALQKGEGATDPRGSQFVRDFSDLELVLDPFGKGGDETLITIRGVKEKTEAIVGKTYAYYMGKGGTQILDFHEVSKCSICHGSGFVKGKECDTCLGKKYVGQGEELL